MVWDITPKKTYQTLIQVCSLTGQVGPGGQVEDKHATLQTIPAVTVVMHKSSALNPLLRLAFAVLRPH